MEKFLRFLLLALFLFPFSARCQRSPAPPTYLRSAFDASQKQLPAGFRGHSAQKIFETLWLKRDAISKSEFETESDYKQRVRGFSKQPIAPGLRPADTFAFIAGEPIVEYDAEKQQMKMRFPFSSNPNNQAAVDGFEALWSESISQKGAYLGTNAFGIVRRVMRETISQYVLVTQVPRWEPATQVFEWPLVVSMSPLKAKSVKNSFHALIICSLVAPFVASSDASFEATLEEPIDRTFIIRTLYVEMKEIWIIDSSTGEIFGRFGKDALEIKAARD